MKARGTDLSGLRLRQPQAGAANPPWSFVSSPASDTDESAGQELLFWIILGVGVTTRKDLRNLYRLSPEVITTVEHAVLGRGPS